MTTGKKKFFTQRLTDWHLHDNRRDLPWKEERDPYKIWLSEIMLQQTRAEQGRMYYLRFVEAFPTVSDLALADDDLVFRMWQGLGYYNRCKNMLATARYIHGELAGKFPDTYEAILQLKGVGEYTAAAIASFAYDLPFAVLDGNVYRILARYLGIATPSDTTSGKKLFAGLAAELLDTSRPSLYNQAIMDFGATVCTPKNAQCNSCPLQRHCVAHAEGTVYLLPVKEKKMIRKDRYFNFFLLEYDGMVWIQKRKDRDVWENLHQFFLIESDCLWPLPEAGKHIEMYLGNAFVEGVKQIYEIRQQLTHQNIASRFFRVQLSALPEHKPEDGMWVNIKYLQQYAFPKTIATFLSEMR